MTRDEIRTALFESIQRIAPESEPGNVPSDADLREELDLDSMDFLNVIVRLHERLGVDIPERDYPQLFTVASAVDYLAAHAGV